MTRADEGSSHMTRTKVRTRDPTIETHGTLDMIVGAVRWELNRLARRVHSSGHHAPRVMVASNDPQDRKDSLPRGIGRRPHEGGLPR